MTPMNEQENLLSGITIAHNLMHRVVSLQQRINQLTTPVCRQDGKRRLKGTLFSMQSGASLSRSRLSRARHLR